MSVTTLPFMEAVAEDRDDDWYRIWCDLCWPDWRSMGGRLDVCEDEAADHLDDIHPRRYDRACAKRMLHWRVLGAEVGAAKYPQSPYCN